MEVAFVAVIPPVLILFTSNAPVPSISNPPAMVCACPGEAFERVWNTKSPVSAYCRIIAPYPDTIDLKLEDELS